ncbi:LPO_1073/Vpar_1526 family protein [Sorangium sp. So ce269]
MNRATGESDGPTDASAQCSSEEIAAMNLSRIANSTVGSSAVGERSTAITINHHQGLTFTEAERVFALLFEQSFPRLVEAARDTATQRVDELSATFVRIATEQQITQEQLGQLAEPDVQAVLNSAIHAGARRDSKELHELLARLIVQRLQSTEGDVWALALNESVDAAGKLNANQLRLLALAFMFKHARWCTEPYDWKTCNEFLNKTVTPLLEVQSSDGDLLHLEYTGCGTLDRLYRPQFDLFVGRRLGSLFKGVPKDPATLTKIIDRESRILAQLRKVMTDTKSDTLILTTVGLVLGSIVVEQLSGARVPIEHWISENGVDGAFVGSGDTWA